MLPHVCTPALAHAGGVVSGLGKGVTASSIGVLLKACGHRVTSIKIGELCFGPQLPLAHAWCGRRRRRCCLCWGGFAATVAETAVGLVIRHCVSIDVGVV